MNIRKNIDYSEMYETLDKLMAKQLRQMELYREIGKAVCVRRLQKSPQPVKLSSGSAEIEQWDRPD